MSHAGEELLSWPTAHAAWVTWSAPVSLDGAGVMESIMRRSGWGVQPSSSARSRRGWSGRGWSVCGAHHDRPADHLHIMTSPR